MKLREVKPGDHFILCRNGIVYRKCAVRKPEKYNRFVCFRQPSSRQDKGVLIHGSSTVELAAKPATKEEKTNVSN